MDTVPTATPATSKSADQTMADYQSAKNKELMQYVLIGLAVVGGFWVLSKVL